MRLFRSDLLGAPTGAYDGGMDLDREKQGGPDSETTAQAAEMKKTVRPAHDRLWRGMT